jgi:sRNA-binding carbon storage regulator CsrA
MLVLSRGEGESIQIGDDITVTIVRTGETCESESRHRRA